MLRVLYLIYFWLIVFPVFFVLTMLCALVTFIGCTLGGSKWFSFYPGMVWSRAALWLTLCPIEIRGKENLKDKKGPYVVVANHQGAFDIFMMYGYLGIRFKWVMKEGIKKIPFVGVACKAAGFIFVDDHKRSSINNTMIAAKRVLAENTSIFIFPEGSRTKTGRMIRFKKGAFVMANELQVPIVPISIDGSFNVLPIGKISPRPHKLILTIHPQIRMEEMGIYPMNIQYTAREAQARIASVLLNEQECNETGN